MVKLYTKYIPFIAYFSVQHSHIINLILSPLAPKEKNNDQFGITALHVAHLFRVKNHGSVVLSDQAHFLPHFKGSVHYVYFLENKYIQYIKYYLVTLYPCEISILLAGSTEPFSSSGIRFALSAFFLFVRSMWLLRLILWLHGLVQKWTDPFNHKIDRKGHREPPCKARGNEYKYHKVK